MKNRIELPLLLLFVCVWIKAVNPSSSGVFDADFYWHIKYGQWILSNASLPTGDIFSWTFDGHPYLLTQWLGEVVMALVYNWFGLLGTALLAAFLTGVLLLFVSLSCKKYVDDRTAIIVAIMCNLYMLVAPMRPQLFSFALFAVGVWLILSWRESRNHRYLIAIPVLLVLWINTHGAFIMGFVLLGLTATIHSYDYWVSRQGRGDVVALWITLICSLICVVALNPYGFEAIRQVVAISGLQSSNVISEWQHVDLRTEIGWFYLINFAGLLGVMIVGNVKPDRFAGTVAIFFLFFGILANRQVAFIGPVIAPIICTLLRKTPQYEKLSVHHQNSTNRSSRYACAAVAIGLIFCFPLASSKAFSNTEQKTNYRMPVAAVSFMEKNKLTSKVMSDTLEASYLISKDIKVFIDGRMDLYKDKFYFEWYLAARAAPGWEKILSDFTPKTLLLRNDMAIRQAALSTGQWFLVYEDSKYSVLVPELKGLQEITPSVIDYLNRDGVFIRQYLP